MIWEQKCKIFANVGFWQPWRVAGFQNSNAGLTCMMRVTGVYVFLFSIQLTGQCWWVWNKNTFLCSLVMTTRGELRIGYWGGGPTVGSRSLGTKLGEAGGTGPPGPPGLPYNSPLGWQSNCFSQSWTKIQNLKKQTSSCEFTKFYSTIKLWDRILNLFIIIIVLYKTQIENPT